MQFSVRTRITKKKTNKQTCRHYQHYPTPALFVLFFYMIEPTVLLVLVVYFKNMLQMVTMQRPQQLSPFSLLPNSVKCSACAVARKIEIYCFCRNLAISTDQGVRISRHLAKTIYFRKASLIFTVVKLFHEVICMRKNEVLSFERFVSIMAVVFKL